MSGRRGDDAMGSASASYARVTRPSRWALPLAGMLTVAAAPLAAQRAETPMTEW
jgi:hypothetical protein